MRNLLIMVFVVALSSCAHFKPVMRTIRDVAHLLCCVEEARNAEAADVSVEEICEDPTVRAAYEEAARAAGKTAAGRVSATRVDQ